MTTKLRNSLCVTSVNTYILCYHLSECLLLKHILQMKYYRTYTTESIIYKV